jgi:glutamine amidotransferase
MVTIVAYNKHNSEFIKNLLGLKDFEIKISTLEKDIANSDKIILPDAINFNTAYRKLQFCNLFSLLRLINKPVLGINVGLHMMCNRILNKDKIGLGLFDFDTSYIDHKNENNKYKTGTVKLIGKSHLIKNISDGAEVVISKQNFQPINNLTKSAILFEDSECTLTLENGNYFGVELNFEKNLFLGKQIIENFVLI